MNDELQRMCKEITAAYVKVPFHNLHGRSDETDKNIKMFKMLAGFRADTRNWNLPNNK